jgi:hypothetical protein
MIMKSSLSPLGWFQLWWVQVGSYRLIPTGRRINIPNRLIVNYNIWLMIITSNYSIYETTRNTIKQHETRWNNIFHELSVTSCLA